MRPVYRNTDLDAFGGRDVSGDDYSQMPKGSHGCTGRVFHLDE